RGRHAGIIRRLRWHTKFRFKLRHTRRQYLHLRGQRLNLRPQRQDQGIFLVVRQATEVGELGHPKLESWPPWSRQPFIDSASRALSDRGGWADTRHLRSAVYRQRVTRPVRYARQELATPPPRL